MGEEEEKKTTPFDEAIDWIGTCVWFIFTKGKVEKSDVDWSYFEKNGRVSEEAIRDAFINSAGAKDGWEAVKEINEFIKQQEDFVRSAYPENKVADRVSERTREFIQHLCEDNGKEL